MNVGGMGKNTLQVILKHSGNFQMDFVAYFIAGFPHFMP